MNLLARKVLLLLFAATFFLSCEDPGEIGIEESIPNPFDVSFIDIPLNPKTYFADSVNSTNTSSLMFGSYYDPNFGKVTSIPYMEIGIGDPNFIIPENTIFDSLIFYLDVNYTYGGTDNSAVQIDARTFDGQIDTRFYFTKDSIPTDAINRFSRLGSTVVPFDPGNENAIKFKMSDAFGNQLLNKMIFDLDSVVRNQDYFREFFSGMKLVVTGDSDGLIGIDPASDSTKLSVYFHYEDLPGLTVFRQYDFNVRRGFNSIQADLTGTPLASAGPPNSVIDPSPAIAYHNPALGYFLKLDISGVYNFRDTAQNIIVNRADLILDLDKDYVTYSPPEEIRFYMVNSSNDFIVSDFSYIPRSVQFESPEILQVPTYADNPFKFEYDSMNYRYNEQVTFYINNLLNEKLSDSSLLVMPVAPLRDGTKTDSIYYTRINNADQFVIPKTGAKLRIFYSKFE